MSILYKTGRNVRFVLFRKNSNKREMWILYQTDIDRMQKYSPHWFEKMHSKTLIYMFIYEERQRQCSVNVAMKLILLFEINGVA